MHTYRSVIGAFVLTLLAVPATGVAGNPSGHKTFGKIVGFGDSLSDPGNFYAVIGEDVVAPYAPIPSAPYEIGGNRFSNGPTWLEQMTRKLKDPRSGRPAFQVAGLFSNYAFGGARARPAGDVPDLSTQVGLFLAENGQARLDDSLVVLWIGSNDVRDELISLSTASTAEELDAAFAIVPAALGATAANIQALYASGARQFLVLNVPNFAITPAVRGLGQGAAGTAAYLSSAYDLGLDLVLDQFETAFADIEISRLDVWTLLNSVALNPEDFGLSDASEPCLRFYVVENAVCDDPDKHLFWDGLHPTQAAHAILAAAAALALR
jgi:phospholipase/lecithinase/hemolysin